MKKCFIIQDLETGKYLMSYDRTAKWTEDVTEAFVFQDPYTAEKVIDQCVAFGIYEVKTVFGVNQSWDI